MLFHCSKTQDRGRRDQEVLLLSESVLEVTARERFVTSQALLITSAPHCHCNVKALDTYPILLRIKIMSYLTYKPEQSIVIPHNGA